MRCSHLEALVLLGSAIAAPVSAAAEPSRPRGVGPEFAKFYKDAEKFTCISTPSIQLSLSQINDDYCDCPDGSDEPGTAACAYLSPLSPSSPSEVNSDDINTTIALPGFYCKNKGHIPTYVPFTNVNDGICDYDMCCDGSDEWEGVGGVKCEDKCKEIGKEWRKQDELRQKSLGSANRKRKELVTEAARLRKEVEDRLQTLGTEIEGAEMKVKDLEKELAEVERLEKTKVIKGPKKGGKFSVLAGVARQRMDELRESLTRVRGERDASRGRVTELEEILEKFSVEYNPNFNDEGVKRAVKAWQDYAAKGKGPGGDAAHDRDLDEILKPDNENGLNWEEFDGPDEGEVDVLYQFEQYLPKPLRDWVDIKLRELRVYLIENGVIAGDTDSGSSETKAVQDARSRLKTAENDLNGNRNELKKHQEDLDMNYGPDDVFRALKGQCVSQDSGEYTYELCWMDKTTQKPKKGGANTGMGKFVRIEMVTVDEDVSPEGKGLGTGERIALKYENGQHCWNGPNRSTTVILACAEKDEIWKIREEEKCVYRMEVGTPAVCEALTGKPAAARDEL
ncbi:glucosidase 2 subunit beta precursor [Saccharata proteae CBS 121410]|uniref:Glucosidase 2 subunit beta n=1 Tax=Saccharata proteae CBS 121410 TaxID=1314787 RepID=A0A9P4LW67_9PEZI|nr:glucosidase 2 subunit beta precursor [Saccharata proteae CBS 121410]